MDDPKHDSVSMLYPHSHHQNHHRWHLLYLSSSFLFMVMICFCWNISARFTDYQCIANKTVAIRKTTLFKGTWYKFRYSIRCCRSSHQRCSLEKGVLRNFSKFTGQQLRQSLFFNKVTGLRPATLLKRRLWHSCFPVNFEKFLRISFLQSTSGRLLLMLVLHHFTVCKVSTVASWRHQVTPLLKKNFYTKLC